MIEVKDVTKRYGDTVAVDHLSFTVQPGIVTGFLGPTGAGKSTTMRMILGLDAPTSGAVTVNGRPYAAYRRPLAEVGALLDAKAMHGGRSASNHLLCLALSNGIGRARVDRVLTFGASSRIELTGPDGQHLEAEVSRDEAAALNLQTGQQVKLNASRLSMFDAVI